MPKEGNESLHPKAERFMRLLRKNFYVSIAIMLGAALLALAQAFELSVAVWEKLRPTPTPKLAVTLLDQRRPQSEMSVTPVWKDQFGAGFSDSVPITIGLANNGTGPATNVDVYLIYPPGVFNIQQSTGKSTFPSAIGLATALTGYETVQRFSVERIDPSPIVNVVEKELRLQFRFRDIFGIPVVNKSLPVILPLSMDFRWEVKALGEFPIKYVVRSAESDKPVFGTLLLKAKDFTKPETGDITLKTVQENIGPGQLPGQFAGKLAGSRDIGFFADGMDGAHSTVSSKCSEAKPTLLMTRASELENDKNVWLDIKIIDTTKILKEIILIDHEKNGSLDSVFVSIGENWMELKPDSKSPYIPLNNILSPSDDPCILLKAYEKIGLKK